MWLALQGTYLHLLRALTGESSSCLCKVGLPLLIGEKTVSRPHLTRTNEFSSQPSQPFRAPIEARLQEESFGPVSNSFLHKYQRAAIRPRFPDVRRVYFSQKVPLNLFLPSFLSALAPALAIFRPTRVQLGTAGPFLRCIHHQTRLNLIHSGLSPSKPRRPPFATTVLGYLIGTFNR